MEIVYKLLQKSRAMTDGKVRLLHPLGLVWVIFFLMISPIGCIVSDTAITEIPKMLKMDTKLW